MKIKQLTGATITHIYDHLKPISKRHPEFLNLHIGTNDNSKYMPNEIVDKVLALKRFVVSQNKECKVIISVLAMRLDSQRMGMQPRK